MLKRALRFLIRDAWNRPYRPRLELGYVFREVMRSAGGKVPADTHPRRARSVEAMERALARRFRARGRPVFFCTPEQLSAAILRVRQAHPDWVARTRARVARDLDTGLDIYSGQGPRLDGRFPWGSLAPREDRDHLYPYRPQRFAFAPQMALAAVYDSAYLDPFIAILESWLAFAARDRHGLAYATKLVVTQRFLALSWAWAFLASRPGEGLDTQDYRLESHILRILHADARFLLKGMGGEFPNNHLLADWFIGWYIASLFPELIPRRSPSTDYHREWLGQVEQQTYGDGTSFEHSVHYHEFVSELVVAYLLIAIRNGQPVPAWIIERARRMLRFQVTMQRVEPAALALGDTTEDPIFPLDVGRDWAGAAMHALHRALFEPDMPAANPTEPALERAFWMLGGELDGSALRAGLTRGAREAGQQSADAAQAGSPTTGLDCYPDGGFYHFQDGDERVLFRSGPAPGLPLCAGHMHADLLSVYLSLGGTPVIMEAGTYTYVLGPAAGPQPDWRRYFLGPAAHNGLSIEAADPLEPITRAFRSPDVPTRVAVSGRSGSAWIAWVEGRVASANAYDGARRGVIRVSGEYWLVYDLFPSLTDQRAAWVGFQLAANAEITGSSEDRTEIRVGSEPVAIATSLGRPQTLRGELEPVGGWISTRYGSITPAVQLRYRARGPCAGHLIARARAGDRPWRVQMVSADDQGVAIEAGSGNVIDYILVPRADGEAGGELALWGMRFVGALLWLRTVDRMPRELRAVRCRRLIHEALGIDLGRHEAQGLLVIRQGADGPVIDAGSGTWEPGSQWGGESLGG